LQVVFESPDGARHERAIALFARTLFALLANAFLHGVPGAPIVVTMTATSGRLAVKIENSRTPMQAEAEAFGGDFFSVSTRGVAEACLQEINGRLVEFPTSEHKGAAVSEFVVAYGTSYLGEEIAWLVTREPEP
jgi:hypothetical protein